jgi:predicted protein tyrosine phosphatase
MNRPLWKKPFYLNMLGINDNDGCKNWITPTLCIGDYKSSYKPFDVVVNINHPANYVPHEKLGKFVEKLDNHVCTIYVVGMHDDDSEPLERYIDTIMSRLLSIYQMNRNTRFLFHCHAGRSRSVAFTVAFMVEVMKIPLEESLSLVRQARPIIKPCASFINTLRKRYTVPKEETE